MSRNEYSVDPALAVLAASLAATVSKNGVMAGGHDNMIALQAIRLHSALSRVSDMVEADSELVLEPRTEFAIERLNSTIKEAKQRQQLEAEERATAQAEKAAASSDRKTPGGKGKSTDTNTPPAS